MKHYFVFAAIVGAVSISACQSNVSSNKSSATRSAALFSQADNSVISFPALSRRKWDSPLIVDLDLDGFQDLLVTEHGQAASIYWNNNGTFSEPVVVIRGDTHGASAADYDGDGKVELVISQGGGAGTNPRLPKVFEIDGQRNISKGKTFDHFEKGRGRAVKYVDVDNNGDLDMVLSGFPMKSQKQGANHLYKNDGNGNFEFVGHLPQAKWLGYRVLVTDFNNDYDSDLIFYGGADLTAVQGSKGFDFTNVTASSFGELRNISDISSITEIDFDNDGDQDLFLTRAKHQFKPQTFLDQELKTFAFFGRFKPFAFDDLQIQGDLILENLQMAYPSYDVFVGANKTQLAQGADRGAERNYTISQSEAKGWPEQRAEKGLYIGYLGNDMWRIAIDTNSTTAAVVHNVLNTPSTITQQELPAYLLENKGGKFVDVTQSLNVTVGGQSTSATTGDFNNDGWQDLLIVPYGNMANTQHPILLLNQQGKQFNQDNTHGLYAGELGVTGGSIENFDYDSDGDLDIIYSHERGKWHLFENSTNKLASKERNFIIVDVNTSPKHKVSSIAASVEVQACDKSIVRRVGATSSPFSQGENTKLHFGLGSCNKVDSVNVVWSNLERQSINNVSINTLTKIGN
ncbi:CRTAC1 family protein [Thalassomonas sp. M1454]|uniref:CRTAC1 family protein n=1 Tax=Thalassomonas sp. M1454 TaxID=2594477 RepID=UPI00118066DB|nr:CRTAC1 family protein [Thalassomonas sp. M1454]TRX57980.1 CRTAC1 family protein [Thalassomonas sp. M1454]